MKENVHINNVISKRKDKINKCEYGISKINGKDKIIFEIICAFCLIESFLFGTS